MVSFCVKNLIAAQAFQKDAVLKCLMPALDLALGLRVAWQISRTSARRVTLAGRDFSQIVPILGDYDELEVSYLAPDIVADILAGRRPPELSVKPLIRTSQNLPLDWRSQRAFLGMA